LMAIGRRQPAQANIPFDSFTLLANWHALVIRELARLPNFIPDAQGIAGRLKGLLSVQDVKRALKILIDTNLLTADESGRLFPSDETLRTSDEINSFAIRKYHASCLELGKEILQTVSVEEREFASMNIVLDDEGKSKLKDLIKEMRER